MSNCDSATLTGESQFSIKQFAASSPESQFGKLQLANIYQADLIASGCRGLTGLKRILEGAVSAEVVAEAPCSVLVVRAK